MTTEFTWIRHGETAENLAGIIQGHLDTQLNARGRAQAQCAARRLQNEHFDHIFCSDLLRARETAEIIAQFHTIAVEPLPGLREWHLGELEGQTKEEIMRRYPEVLEAFHFEPGEVVVPGGESHAEFFQRVAHCLDHLSEMHAGQKLLLVTHGGTLRAIYHRIAGPVRSDAMLPVTTNCAYGKFYRHDQHYQLACWNDISHLKEIGVRQSLTF